MLSNMILLSMSPAVTNRDIPLYIDIAHYQLQFTFYRYHPCSRPVSTDYVGVFTDKKRDEIMFGGRSKYVVVSNGSATKIVEIWK